MPEYLLLIIRSVFAFIFMLFLARLMGKKQVSQLTFFDYIVGISVGSMAANLAINPGITITAVFIGLSIWTALVILMGLLSQKSYRFRQLAEGHPNTLIKNGNVLEENLKKEKMTTEDLMTLLREKKAFKLSDVEFAVMETNGKLSVMKKSEAQPLTPKSHGLTVEEEHDPRIVIIDGHVMEKSLEDYGYTSEWLLGELMKQGATDFTSVFLAQIDSKGNVYADLYHDKLKESQIKQKPLVAASLKKVQADLVNFALQTNDTDAKQIYQQQANHLTKVIQELHPYLKQ